MSVLPYHKRYHSDALAGFMPLTLEERGAYQTILDMIYDRGGPLIDNERLLAGYMNCSIRKWRQLRESLIEKGKIRIDRDGLISNSRARKEIENQSKTHRKLIESASKGGKKRAENEKKANENNETGQATLEPSLEATPQVSRAGPETRNQNSNITPTSVNAREPSIPADVRSVMEAGGFISPPSDLGLLKTWYGAGADLDQDILPTMRRLRAGADRPPFKLKFFDAAIREKLDADERKIAGFRAISDRYRAEETRATGGGG